MDLRDSFTHLKLIVQGKQVSLDQNGRKSEREFEYTAEKNYTNAPWSRHSSDVTGVSTNSVNTDNHRSTDRSFESIPSLEEIEILDDITIQPPAHPLTIPYTSSEHARMLFHDDTYVGLHSPRVPTPPPRPEIERIHNNLNYATVRRVPVRRCPRHQGRRRLSSDTVAIPRQVINTNNQLDTTGNYEPNF